MELTAAAPGGSKEWHSIRQGRLGYRCRTWRLDASEVSFLEGRLLQELKSVARTLIDAVPWNSLVRCRVLSAVPADQRQVEHD